MNREQRKENYKRNPVRVFRASGSLIGYTRTLADRKKTELVGSSASSPGSCTRRKRSVETGGTRKPLSVGTLGYQRLRDGGVAKRGDHERGEDHERGRMGAKKWKVGK